MRKDYIATENSEEHETDFVERYWTSVWEKEGGPKNASARIPKKDEFGLMAPYLRTLHGKPRILDGGCGLGDWVLALKNLGYDAVGIDLSRATISQLLNLFPEATFCAGDIRATEFAPNSFDAYYSWGVFEHFESGPQDCLREARRILRPGGLLFLSVPLDNLRLSVLGALSRPSRHDTKNLRFYQYRFTRAELARELCMAGFELLDIRPIHKRQGVLRCLHHEFGMRYEWVATRAMAAGLAPIIPGWAIAHMVWAAARKPAA